MSFKATNWAWEQNLLPTVKLILMAICDGHNEGTGQCNPSFEFLSEKVGVSRATVIRSIRQLTDQGYISLLNSRKTNGQQLTNQYILHIEKAEYQIDTPPNEAEYQISESRVSSGDTQYEPEEKNRKSISHVSTQKQQQPQNENPLFEKFWQAYPDKTGKTYSFKIFSKLSVQDQQLAANSMPAFLDWISEKRKTFKDYSPPNPSTYLNQRRFDDHKPVEKAPIDWAKLMPILRANKTWTKPFGPPPNHPDCVVPKQYLQAGDGIGWHG